VQKRTPCPHLIILIISDIFYIMSRLLTLPPNLEEIHTQLIHATKPIFMNETQWDAFFPYMDNVQSLHKMLGEIQQGLTTSYYHCW
jgi:hypothetical protein